MRTALVLLLLVTSLGLQAKETPELRPPRILPPGGLSLNYEQWIAAQDEIAMRMFLHHTGRPDGLPGSVIASPERGMPDYYFHWVRDAALIMQSVNDIGRRGAWNREATTRLLMDYAEASKLHQDFIYEPKFHVNGAPYTGEWCRPQNDGPALRAIALLGLARERMASGDISYVRSNLYDNALPASTLIKKDLEFVAHNWRNPSCDLWEETYGDHFYTRMVQRRALVEGAELAEAMGDHMAAAFYRHQAHEMEPEILKHWDAERAIFRVTLNAQYEDKPDGIDGAVLLAFLHGHTADGFLKYSDPRVISTLHKLTAHFKALYPINQIPGLPGVGIGRYTNDTFNKERGRYGNPWFLLTAAAGQVALRAAEEVLTETGDLARAISLYRLGDSFLRRVHLQAGGGAVIDEQFDRYSGEMTSAPNLTWSNKETADAAVVRRRLHAQFSKRRTVCEARLRGAERTLE